MNDTSAAIRGIVRAQKMANDLCAGRREWLMSIPARPGFDPDIVIGDALRAAKAIIKAQEREITDLRQRLEQEQA